MDWKSIETSDSYKAYSPTDREIIKRQWFKENIESSQAFKKYSPDDQERIYKGFMSEPEPESEPAPVPQQAQASPSPVAESKPTGRSLLGTAKDIGITGIKGAMGLTEAVVGAADIARKGLPLGRYLPGVGESLEKYAGWKPGLTREALETEYTPEQQKAFREVAQAKGFVPTIKAMGQYPSTIAHAGIESAPLLLLGGGVGGAARAAGVGEVASAALGEGLLAAGLQREQIRQEVGGEKRMTPEKELAAIASGLGTAAISTATGGVARKLGIEDIDIAITNKIGNAVAKKVGAETAEQVANKFGKTTLDIAKKVVGGGALEGLEELTQSAQEQVWMNAATDRPLMEGVKEAAAQGAIVGAAMGTATNAVMGISDIRGSKSVDEAIAGFNKAVATEPTEQAPVATEPTAFTSSSTSAPTPRCSTHWPISCGMIHDSPWSWRGFISASAICSRNCWSPHRSGCCRRTGRFSSWRTTAPSVTFPTRNSPPG